MTKNKKSIVIETIKLIEDEIRMGDKIDGNLWGVEMRLSVEQWNTIIDLLKAKLWIEQYLDRK